MKASKYLIACILFSIFLIQLSSAVADWTDFGFGSRISQAQSTSYDSQFGNAQIITDSMGNGLSTNNSNIPYQALVPEIDSDSGNYLILTNGNYLQIYDKDFVLIDEEITGRSEGQLSALNYIGTFGNDEYIVGLWRPNTTTFSFKAYNFTSSITLLFENNYTTTYPATSNGVKCFTALGYGECYAFIDEYNGTDYEHSLLIISYNATSGSADFTNYYIADSSSKILEPPAWIDWDFDGTLEFLGFTQNRVYVIDYNGNSEMNYTQFGFLVGAKFIRTDAGNYKVIIVENNPNINPPCPSLSYNCVRYRAIRTDGTTFWDIATGSLNSGDTWRNNGLAIEDYDGDNYDDIWALNTKTGTNHETRFQIYKGTDGSTIYSHNPSPFSVLTAYPDFQLTLARMDDDDTPDFVGVRNGYAYLWLTENQSMNFSNNIGADSCIPADLDYDGLTDIICTYPSGTTKYSTNYTNQNAFITEVEFSPALIIEVNSTLTVTISATDPESDTIFYSIRCNDSASYTTDTDGNVKTCGYDTIGSYNVTVRVRDEFHSIYDTLTQEIQVSETAYVQTEEGVAIPVDLVDTDNYQQGFLPQIYYGTLGFLSNILSPFIVLVIFILTLAMIVTVFAIFKKLVKKASS